MAPKGSKRQGPKRASQAATSEANKKPKLDSTMLGVVEGLRQATDLSEGCRAMLEACVLTCLGSPANERHEVQSSMVTCIGEALEEAEIRLRQVVDDETAKVAKAEEACKQGEHDISNAKGTLEVKNTDLAEKEDARNAALQSAKSAKVALTEVLTAQTKGDASLAEAGKHKGEFEVALKDHVGYLKEADGFDAKIAKTHANQAMRIAKKLELDNSLLTALATACATAPSQRGSFDIMVISELENSFQRKIDALTEEMNTGSEATASRMAAVTAAEQVVQAADSVTKEAEAALAAARTAQAEAAAGLREAEQGSKVKAAEQTEAEESKKAAEQVLENFVGNNMLCFSTLRDKVSKPEGDASLAPDTSAPPAAAESTSPDASISVPPPAGNEAP